MNTEPIARRLSFGPDDYTLDDFENDVGGAKGFLPFAETEAPSPYHPPPISRTNQGRQLPKAMLQQAQLRDNSQNKKPTTASQQKPRGSTATILFGDPPTSDSARKRPNTGAASVENSPSALNTSMGTGSNSKQKVKVVQSRYMMSQQSSASKKTTSSSTPNISSTKTPGPAQQATAATQKKPLTSTAGAPKTVAGKTTTTLQDRRALIQAQLAAKKFQQAGATASSETDASVAGEAEPASAQTQPPQTSLKERLLEARAKKAAAAALSKSTVKAGPSSTKLVGAATTARRPPTTTRMTAATEVKRAPSTAATTTGKQKPTRQLVDQGRKTPSIRNLSTAMLNMTLDESFSTTNDDGGWDEDDNMNKTIYQPQSLAAAPAVASAAPAVASAAAAARPILQSNPQLTAAECQQEIAVLQTELLQWVFIQSMLAKSHEAQEAYAAETLYTASTYLADMSAKLAAQAREFEARKAVLLQDDLLSFQYSTSTELEDNNAIEPLSNEYSETIQLLRNNMHRMPISNVRVSSGETEILEGLQDADEALRVTDTRSIAVKSWNDVSSSVGHVSNTVNEEVSQASHLRDTIYSVLRVESMEQSLLAERIHSSSSNPSPSLIAGTGEVHVY